MSDDQLARLLEATAELMADRDVGPWGLSARELAAAAGVPSAEAQRLLADPRAALADVFELGVERARRAAAWGDGTESRWLSRVRASIAALLGFMEREPALARVLVLYPTGGGERLHRLRGQALAECCAFLDLGRLERRAGGRPVPGPTALAVLGGILGILQEGLLAEPPRAPMELYGPLLCTIALPYLGPVSAQREFERPPPRLIGPLERRPAGSARATLQDGPGMTYRTLRVLEAIADRPGASNREVSERAGIVDQGQASKLLGRLERRGLVERLGASRARGAPNAWGLTAEGELALSV